MIARFLIITLISVCLTACSKSSDDLANGSLTIGIWYQPTTLDPHLATLPVSQQIAAALYTGLVSYNGAGQIIPGIAESWNVSPDGITYVFRLKQAKWSDGSRITADTFVQSFRRLFEQHNAAITLLSSINNGDAILAGQQSVKNLGVKALAEDVLEIKLDRPLPALLAVLAGPAGSPIAKSALHKPANWWRNKDNIITNGAYKVVKWKAGSEIILQQRDGQEQEQIPTMYTIRYVVMQDAPLALKAFDNGSVQILDVNPVTTNALDNSSRTTRDALHWESAWTVTGLKLNIYSEPLKDIRVRRALAMAIDRFAMIAAAFPDQHYMPSMSLVPPTLPGYGAPAYPDWSMWEITQRQSEAARLLQEAGYSNEAPLRLKLKLTNHDEDLRLGQALTDQFASLPVKLSIERQTLSEISANIVNGDYQLARTTITSNIDSPEQYLLPYRCLSRFSSSKTYCNTEVDSILSTAQKKSDIAARASELHRAESLILDDIPFLPLYIPASRNLISRKLAGYVDSPTGLHTVNSLKHVQTGYRGKL